MQKMELVIQVEFPDEIICIYFALEKNINPSFLPGKLNSLILV